MTMNEHLNKRQWIDRAVNYMLNIKLFNVLIQSEVDDAYQLAETLYENDVDEAGICTYDPIESVDEEISYWGD